MENCFFVYFAHCLVSLKVNLVLVTSSWPEAEVPRDSLKVRRQKSEVEVGPGVCIVINLAHAVNEQDSSPMRAQMKWGVSQQCADTAE